MKITKFICAICIFLLSFGCRASEMSNMSQNEQAILKAKNYIEKNVPEFSEMSTIKYEILSETEKELIVSVVAMTIITEKTFVENGKELEEITSAVTTGANLHFDKKTLKFTKIMFSQ